MKIVTSDEFLKGGTFTQPTTTAPEQSQPQGTVASGFAKGVGDTIMGVGAIGRNVQKSLPSIFQGLGSNPTSEPSLFDKGSDLNTQAKETLKADNTPEKAGKVLEFAAEMLFPTSATKTGAVLEGIGKRITSLGEDAANSPLRERLIDAVTNLDDKTKTALSRTPREVFDQFVQAGKAAMTDDRNRTPLEMVGDKVITGLQDLQKQAQSIGAQKSELMKLGGITPFKGDGIQAFKQGLQSFLNSKTAIAEDKPVLNEIFKQFKSLGDTPSAGQVDKFIDFAQEKLYSAERNLTLPTSSGTVSRLKSLIGELNSKLKDQLSPEYRKLNDEYAKIAGLSQELNTRLGKEGASVGAFVKRLFSPSDAHTKQLFEELQNLTGEDYFRDARLAKFVMDTLGDVRVKSLLEQVDNIPTSASGLLGKAFDFAKDKLTDPLNAARRFIDSQAKNGAGQAFSAVPTTLQSDDPSQQNPQTILTNLALAGFMGKVTPQKKAEAKKVLDEMYARYVKAAPGSTKKQLQKAYQSAFNAYIKWSRGPQSKPK